MNFSQKKWYKFWYKSIEKNLETVVFQGFRVAGAEGLEPSARGFGAALGCPETIE